MFESRAQARRVAERLTRFAHVDLNFGHITDIGHGFADDLFRVTARQQPALQLAPLNMAPRVAAMVASVNP